MKVLRMPQLHYLNTSYLTEDVILRAVISPFCCKRDITDILSIHTEITAELE
jgi:hypothetical protein